MKQRSRKMSEIMKEMSECLLRNPDAIHSSEAAHVALMLANIAWNKTVGLGQAIEGYRSAWETIEAENPEMRSEFSSNDVEAIIEELIEYKRQHYPDDQRRILTCGIPFGKIHVEWMDPVAPGVDSKLEMQLYGLVRTGEREQAIEFLREFQSLSQPEAAKQVKKISTDLGLELKVAGAQKTPRYPAWVAILANRIVVGDVSQCRLHRRGKFAQFLQR